MRGCPECPRERRALFFGEIVRRTGLLPSRVENAIAELAANGWVTSDSFEGLRALLVPDERDSHSPIRGRASTIER